MNVVDDNKLQTTGDEIVDRAGKQAMSILASLDGWALKINIPTFYLFGWTRFTVAVPEITIRLTKEK